MLIAYTYSTVELYRDQKGVGFMAQKKYGSNIPCRQIFTL